MSVRYPSHLLATFEEQRSRDFAAVIARSRLGGAPAWSAIALGYVIGNLAAAHVTYHWAPIRPVLAALTVSTALAPMLVLLGLIAPLWLIVPAALLAGAETTIYNTLVNSAMQANLPVHSLDRVTAITGIGSAVLVPVGMGLAGVVAGDLGTSTVMLSGAALSSSSPPRSALRCPPPVPPSPWTATCRPTGGRHGRPPSPRPSSGYRGGGNR